MLRRQDLEGAHSEPDERALRELHQLGGLVDGGPDQKRPLDGELTGCDGAAVDERRVHLRCVSQDVRRGLTNHVEQDRLKFLPTVGLGLGLLWWLCSDDERVREPYD